MAAWSILCVLLVATTRECLSLRTPAFEHGFDTVGDMLFGWVGGSFYDPSNLTEHQKTFYANTYNLAVLAGGGHEFQAYNSTPPDQWPQAKGVEQLKALNPNMKILLYEHTYFGPVEWGQTYLQEHPEYWLKDDNGKVYYNIVKGKVIGPLSLDWRIPDVRKWWEEQSFIFKPGTFDGLLVDGTSASKFYFSEPLNHTMSVEHQKELAQARMYMLGNVSSRWAEQGGVVVGNPLFDYGEFGVPSIVATDLFPLEYHWNYMTGALDEMYASVSTLNRDGSFNVTKMAASIEAIVNMSREGKTVLIKGFPGPCGVPLASVNNYINAILTWPNNSQPKTPEGLKEASAKMLELTLAPFLLVVEPNVWFGYSWFYGMYTGWVTCPSNPERCTAPDNWYPEFKQPLGKPLGPAVRHGNIYTRQFEHASVYVDLDDRTASKVTWKSVGN